MRQKPALKKVIIKKLNLFKVSYVCRTPKPEKRSTKLSQMLLLLGPFLVCSPKTPRDPSPCPGPAADAHVDPRDASPAKIGILSARTSIKGDETSRFGGEIACFQESWLPGLQTPELSRGRWAALAVGESTQDQGAASLHCQQRETHGRLASSRAGCSPPAGTCLCVVICAIREGKHKITA